MVLGATGMLGHVASLYLKKTGKYEVIDVVYRTPLDANCILLDVNDKTKLEQLIFEKQPQYILNCIGVLIKGSQQSPSNAIYLNACLPHLLVDLAHKVGAKLIHISTDCVFSGKKGAYTENDFRDADDIYGRSKALGEIINDTDLTIRTSIIGPELKKDGEGLFHWFMQQTGVIHGYTQAYWSGVTTLELARAIDAAIDQDITGLIHLTNGVKISKFDLLKLFKLEFDKHDITIVPIEGKKVDKSIVNTNHILNYSVKSYNVMISEMKEFIMHNIYEKYL